jgi:hypothetical protein
MQFDKEGGSVTFNSMREFEDAVMIVLQKRMEITVASKHQNSLEVTLLDVRPADSICSRMREIICLDAVTIEV